MRTHIKTKARCAVSGKASMYCRRDSIIIFSRKGKQS